MQNNTQTHTVRLGHRLPALISLGCLLVLWQLATSSGAIAGYLLPSPTSVAKALIQDAPLLFDHSLTTLFEAGLGLVLGIVAGFICATLMDTCTILRRSLQPLLTISQTIPTIALAPLLVLWLGYGTLPKITLVALTSFFPIATALYQGFSTVDTDQIHLLQTFRASRWRIFKLLKIPAAGTYFFSGLRISATYAIVAAVIAEWLGGYSGLGVYMTRVRKSFAYDRMFAVILVISLLSLLLMLLVDLVQRKTMPWNLCKEDSHE